MIQQLQQILARKTRLSSNLSIFKNDLLASIYKGITERKNITQIHKDILKITKASGIPLNYTKPLVNYAFNLTKKAKKQVKEDDISLIALSCYTLFQKEDSYRKMKSVTNEVITKYEADEKDTMLKDELEYNRKLGNPKIFYLASRHNQCAIDHFDWQGKIYIDAQWKTYVKDARLQKIIQQYINQHNIRTIQWVTSKPVWFITRPNCRHYFKGLTVNTVLNNSVTSLIKQNRMTHSVGKRPTQTIAHDTSKKWYTKTNVENIIKKYEDRLDFHQKLYKVKKEPIILKAIQKDKFLIKKWKNFLTSQQF